MVVESLVRQRIVGQQFHSSVAGKSQLVNVAWMVVVFDLLSVRSGLAPDRVLVDGLVEIEFDMD